VLYAIITKSGKKPLRQKAKEEEMPVIYTPKGRAREYSPKALNIYMTCTHGCKYCYAPAIKHMTQQEYSEPPWPRWDIAKKLRAELESGDVPKEQVLLSFIGDVYCDAKDSNQATRDCLIALSEHKVPVAILTKGGNRALRDVDVFKTFGKHIQVGTTLTFASVADSLEWEPNAALPRERCHMLQTLHDSGIRTFVSMEPTIDPKQTIGLIRHTLEYVDVYKIGKINNYNDLDKQIDWTAFLEEAVSILREAGKQFYVKHDLREAAHSVRLYGNEVLADEHNVH